ncbi:MAG: leucine-rich repeat protein, partial [Muribaculaceae bacterium]|nr:leucine-rich repeat protein [Muribaculaceae bacterium]
MKMKKLITILFLLAAILLPSTAAAYDFQVNGIAYKTDLWDDYAMVADWGDEGVLYTGVVTIPESVTNDDTTYPVTKIGAYAFAESTGLTGVNIPASVTEIGDHAFENCSGLP